MAWEAWRALLQTEPGPAPRERRTWPEGRVVARMELLEAGGEVCQPGGGGPHPGPSGWPPAAAEPWHWPDLRIAQH